MTLLSVETPSFLKKQTRKESIKMKKLIKITALSLVLLTLVAAFASCGISKDPYKAKAELEENNYWVDLYEGIDATWWATVYGVAAEGLDAVICAYPEIDEIDQVVTDEFASIDVVYIFYFKDKAAAKDAYDAIEAFMNDYRLKNTTADTFKIKRSGAKIWFGTKDAIKAAK